MFKHEYFTFVYWVGDKFNMHTVLWFDTKHRVSAIFSGKNS